jgi:hypothetical protein
MHATQFHTETFLLPVFETKTNYDYHKQKIIPLGACQLADNFLWLKHKEHT